MHIPVPSGVEMRNEICQDPPPIDTCAVRLVDYCPIYWLKAEC